MKKSNRLSKIFDLNLIKRILVISYKSDKRSTVLRFLLLFVSAILPLINIYLFKLLIDAFAKINDDVYSVLPIILGFGIIQILTVLTNNLTNYYSQIHGDNIKDYMASIIYSKSINLDMQYYDSDEFYDTFEKAVVQSNQRPIAVIQSIFQLIQSSISICIIAAILFNLHWAISIVILFMALPVAYIRWKFATRLVRLKENQISNERESNFYRRVLSKKEFAQELKLFYFGEYILDKFLTIRKKIRLENKTLFKTQNQQLTLVQGLEAILSILVIVVIAIRASNGHISVGDIALYFQSFQKGQGSIGQLLKSLVGIHENRLFLKHIFDFIELPSHIKNHIAPQILEKPISSLSVDNVSFKYPNTEKKILKNISFQANKGEIIAIVGENGSGKSTLVKLLTRLYETDEGTIKLNNVDIKSIDLKTLRTSISVLFQDFSKYFTTIIQNIYLANVHDDLNVERTKQSAISAKAHAFIEALPSQFETQMSRSFKKGEEISGGQWQKIALARTFYKNADLLILDEPTSFIDPLAEEEIFQHLTCLAKEKIILMITHRIYTLNKVDKIIVLENGKIREMGNHEELIMQDGLYKKMFDKQNVK